MKARDFYETGQPDDFIRIRYSDGAQFDLKVQGMVYAVGMTRPVQIVSSRGQMFALNDDDRVEVIELASRWPLVRGF